MNESAISKDQRAQTACWVGLVVQVVLLVLLLVTGKLFEAPLTFVAARFMTGGIIIWLTLVLFYSQRRRVSAEQQETEDLKRSQSSAETQIFEAQDEAFLIEQRRLRWMRKWVVPFAGLVLAAYNIAGTFIGWGWEIGGPISDMDMPNTGEKGPTMAFIVLIGFLAFLYSRYTAGMARVREWTMVRAGASYLGGNALVCLLMLAAIAIQRPEVAWAEPVAAIIIRLLLLVIGIEFVVNFILDFYRPRQQDQESRPAFDSRLLGLVTEPGGIARSIAEAINYQFGFEVSSTWFYQLLKRALLPMVAFMIVCLIALSSVVIVDSNEEAFVERFGVLITPRDEPLQPGLHIKAPWPVDKVFRAPVEEVRQLRVGDATETQDTEVVEAHERLKPILWGQEHEFNPEMMVVVAYPEPTDFSAGNLMGGEEAADAAAAKAAEEAASPNGVDQDSENNTGAAVAVGLLKVSVEIQYKVSAAHDYLYNYLNPEKVVEALAYRVLTDYAAQVEADSFMGPGRDEINAELRRILQQRIDDEDLGIRIVFIGVQEAHPPASVAPAYEDVVAKERVKIATIENARGAAEQLLTSTAGNVERARMLFDAVQKYEDLAGKSEGGSLSEEALAARDRVDALLLGAPAQNIAPAGGATAERIAQAQAAMLTDVAEAESDRVQFEAELAAYEAAPRVYQMRKYLDVLEGAVKNIRKYVIAADASDREVVVIFDKEESGTLELEAPSK